MWLLLGILFLFCCCGFGEGCLILIGLFLLGGLIIVIALNWQVIGITLLYILGALLFIFICLYLFKLFHYLIINRSKIKRKFKKMFDKFSVNPDLKKFARLTYNLNSDQYSTLKNYYKAMSIDLETANKFLESCKGIAFMEEYAKSFGKLSFTQISKLIVETERSEQMLSCAHDILKEYK